MKTNNSGATGDLYSSGIRMLPTGMHVHMMHACVACTNQKMMIRSAVPVCSMQYPVYLVPGTVPLQGCMQYSYIFCNIHAYVILVERSVLSFNILHSSC